MQPEKIKVDLIIPHLHDLIEKECIRRDPNYHEKRVPLIIYVYNPITVNFEFSNNIEKEIEPNTYQFELDKYEYLDFIKNNLIFIAKFNFTDKIVNKKGRIYFTMELL
ncbi:MAG: hypothetical protein IPM42_21360 [Saprospiraceae bacterium]|nr:hypothetical protein [Saprospiraceae bacterium]